MILNVLSHTNYRDLCKYCDGVVPNCHCEFFKTLNGRNFPLTEDIKNKLAEIEKFDTYCNRSLTSKWLKTLKKLKTLVKYRWHSNIGGNTNWNSKIPGKNQNQVQLISMSFCPNISYIPPENFSTRFNNNIIVFLILTNGLFREARNNIFESLLGVYCPNRLRNTKFIDYEGTTYRKLQKSLAREKMLTQEEQERKKMVYNPCNKHVFWAIRPFNFDKEYSYLMFCNKALERQEPWRKYHSGVQKFPRRHIIRRWLNRKWEWETIIDYIFSELSAELNNIDTVRRAQPSIYVGAEVKNVDNITFSQVNNTAGNISLGNTLSTKADILQEAFEKLVYICNTDIQSEIKPLNTVTVRTV